MGDDDRFNDLFTRHQASLLAYCARRIGPTDAGDAVAEVFSVAWRRRSDMPKGDRELPWLYGVARNVVSHHWRSAGRARRLTEKVAGLSRPSAPAPETVVVERAEYAAVRDAVAQLRPADQEVLLLSAWEGLSHREIADVIGCSQAAVDKRMVRAKARLAKQYESMQEATALSPARDRKEAAADDA